MTMLHKVTPERLGAFPDSAFAILMTEEPELREQIAGDEKW
jgi:hypothetical protein